LRIFRLVFFCFFLFPLLFSGQGLNIRTFGLDDGIPQSQIHKIFQDKHGFIWFGSDGGGLTRFDGKKFETFTVSEGLKNDLVYEIISGDDDILWAGTAKGVSWFKKNRFISIAPALDSLNGIMVRSICRDKDGVFWIGTGTGLFSFDGENIKRCFQNEIGSVLSVFADDFGGIWVGTAGKGMFLVKGTELTREIQFPNPENIWAILRTPDGKLLAGTDRGLFEIQEAGSMPWSMPGTKEFKAVVRSLYLAPDNSIWISTLDQGIISISEKGTQKIGKAEGLGIDGAYCTLFDKEGNIWFGTDGNGAAMLGKRIFESVSSLQGMPEEMILSLIKTKKGNWWYGNQQGATFFNGKTYFKYGKKEGLSDDKVWSVMEDREGNIWIGTYGNGVFFLPGGDFSKRKNYSEAQGLSSKNVRTIFQDKNGRIWVGTANGLNLWTGTGFQKWFLDQGLPSNRILSFFQDSQSRLWVGTSGGGLVRLIEARGNISFEIFDEKKGLSDNVVLMIREDKDGNIWTANFGGLSCVAKEGGKILSIRKKDGLNSNTVYALEFSSSNLLLAGTNMGINRIRLDDFFSGGKAQISHFDKNDGFKGIECNTGSVFKDENGKIHFGTIKGIFIYDPEKDIPSPVEPKPLVTGIRLFYEPILLNIFSPESDSLSFELSRLVFKYDQNHLTFDLAPLSFSNPGKVFCKYMVEGLDKTWSEPTQAPSVTYSGIPPGDYKFLLISSNADGLWSTNPTEILFSITPPFWKRWWFYTILALGLTLSITIFIQYREKNLKKIQVMLEKEVDKKTRELRLEKEVVETQNQVIERKNKSITSSIKYAKRIQDSLLPDLNSIRKFLPDFFVFFKPKDIVSGDFYWFAEKNGNILFAAVDCTGHGVPGAFMSLVGNNLLRSIVIENGETHPESILNLLHAGLVDVLKKGAVESDTVDGMDLALCALNPKTKELQFSSTGMPLVVISEGQSRKYKVGKHPAGLITKKEIHFGLEKTTLKKGDMVYLFTDGFPDQFGGKDSDKFLEQNFEKLLLEISKEDTSGQLNLLETAFNTWKGDNAQLDDVLVIGIRI
jgi:ligand-binding sensor domain-containing protein/serine phosphatase RsbU (regulator of sigma subunit)